MDTPLQRIAITAGEPAGIGPDLIAQLLQQSYNSEFVVIGDADLIASRARQLDLPLTTLPYEPAAPATPTETGTVRVAHIALAERAIPGVLNQANADYVLATLKRACEGCLSGEFGAVVTAPVQKSVIAEAGHPFSGHTEYFAGLCGADLPVMLLCADDLRVALLTTHLPLAAVPAEVTRKRVIDTCEIVDRDLRNLFGVHNPRIAVLGLNPHAGEAGQLGLEEQQEIEPAIEQLRSAGLHVTGPLPADSAFTAAALTNFDAVLAMYHDQGLPVLKHAGFGKAVNVTLGLPIIRTSVDHGTALTLAGTGTASSSSFAAALQMAQNFANRTASRHPAK